MTPPYREDALARDRIQTYATAMGMELSDPEQWDFLESTDTLDLQAAPGSGKTSLVSLKLLMLATYWTSTTRGICVLSHTNTAKDEILGRIGNTPAGARLQRYPHFIGTIQSFIHTFLVRPYLRGIEKQLQIVDDEAYAKQATHVLARDPRFRQLRKLASATSTMVRSWSPTPLSPVSQGHSPSRESFPFVLTRRVANNSEN